MLTEGFTCLMYRGGEGNLSLMSAPPGVFTLGVNSPLRQEDENTLLLTGDPPLFNKL